MMRDVGGVRKSIHQSWLAKGLGLGLLCWGFKGVQDEIPREEASTLQIGSVVFPRFGRSKEVITSLEFIDRKKMLMILCFPTSSFYGCLNSFIHLKQYSSSAFGCLQTFWRTCVQMKFRKIYFHCFKSYKESCDVAVDYRHWFDIV